MNRSPTYIPFAHGRYDVAAGLSAFGKSFGNGEADGKVFQFDDQFETYRAAKLASRRERFSKYVLRDGGEDNRNAAIIRFIIDRLAADSPHDFTADSSGDRITLDCRLTGELLSFDRTTMQLLPNENDYRDALDALASQVMEDIAIIQLDGEIDRLAYLHICLPNHWSPEEKIGRPFVEVHRPVAEIEPVNRNATALVRTMISAEKGFIRFAWGITFDANLNHHPTIAATTFDHENSIAFVRVERQTMFGFPQEHRALFTIRTSFFICDELDATTRSALISALESMSPSSRDYKSLAQSLNGLLTWLRGL